MCSKPGDGDPEASEVPTVGKCTPQRLVVVPQLEYSRLGANEVNGRAVVALRLWELGDRG